jgi:hypothetical protein
MEEKNNQDYDSYIKAHHCPSSIVLCKFLRFIEKKFHGLLGDRFMVWVSTVLKIMG